MTRRDTFLWLCNIPELPNDYSHTYSFENKINQKNFFQERRVYPFTGLQYAKKDQSFKVPMNYDTIKHTCNYAVFSNDDDIQAVDGKLYYAFISDMEYINENTTKVYLQLDLIQTYLFDFNLKPSYVDRMHTYRWDNTGEPSKEIEPEDLEFGEHIQTSTEILHQYNDHFLIVASNPLGWTYKENKPLAGDPGPWPSKPGPLPPPPPPIVNPGDPPKHPEPEGDCWRQKKPSQQLVRFVKGFEGYAKNKYKDSGGVWTIGYGITASDGPNYSKLVNAQPVPEDMAGQTLWESITRSQYVNPVYDKMKAWGLDKQCQFDALLSFCFNAGSKWLDESNTLPSYIKNHQWDKVRERWPNYIVYDDSNPPKKQKGLVERRTQEMHMFFGEKYEVRDIPTVGTNGLVNGTYQGNGWLPGPSQGACNQGGTGGPPTPQPPVQPGGSTPVRTMGDSWKLDDGTLVYAPCTGSITAIWPRYSGGSFHSGLDIGAQKGDLIYSPFNMQIEESKDLSIKENDPSGSFGRYVKGIILDDHGQPTKYKCWFAHMSSRWVEKGEKVRIGNILGQVGSTGNSTGPHCHFEIREKPWNYGTGPQNTDSINPKPGAVVGQWINGPKPIKWQGKTTKGGDK